MPKLNPESQLALTEGTLAEVLVAYGITDFTFTPIHSGIQNSSAYITSSGKNYVLRVYMHGHKSNDDIKREIRFQDYLRSHGIPIPIIYPNSEGEELTVKKVVGDPHSRDWQMFLMEFIDGQNRTEQPTPGLIDELATLQARMHLLGVEFAKIVAPGAHRWYDDLHDTHVAEVKEVPIPGQEILNFIERIKAFRYPLGPELPQGYNHLDLDFDGNVLVKNEKVAGIIDFDDLAYSPIIVCLGYAVYQMFLDHGIEVARQYLQTYEKIRPLLPTEKEALSHVVMFRNYALAALRLRLWHENSHVERVMRNLELETQIPKINFFA